MGVFILFLCILSPCVCIYTYFRIIGVLNVMSSNFNGLVNKVLCLVDDDDEIESTYLEEL